MSNGVIASLLNNRLISRLGRVLLMATVLELSVVVAGCSQFPGSTNDSVNRSDRATVSTQSSGDPLAMQPVTSTVLAGKDSGGAGKPNDRSPLGINLAGVVSYSTELPFVDVFKTSHTWFSNAEGAGWDQGGPLALTREGWVASLRPGQYATTGLLDNGRRYPSGNYTLLYDGEGKLDITPNSGKGLTVVSQAPGRRVIQVTTEADGVQLNLRSTNPANPLRNIRFIMPGYEKTYQTQPFNPQFLKALAPFKILRFMDWAGTNGSQLANWGDRTTPSFATQSAVHGVSLEYMIRVANTLHADPWFTIPIRANDDYVRQFATLVRDKLDPSLTVHIEYSNEVWNFGFEQATYAKDQGVKLGLDKDQYLAGAKYYSQRSIEIFKIAETVFGGTKRLDRVIAAQAVNTWSGEQILAWKDAYKQADSYAIAPYFDARETLLNGDKAAQIAQMSQDQVLDLLQADIRGSIKDHMVASAKLAQKYKLTLRAYEGGQQLTSFQFGSNEPQITKLYSEVNRNPRMGNLYAEYLNNWKAAGGSSFNHFSDIGTPSKYGMWGALEYLGQDLTTAPKYQALLRYIQDNPTAKAGK
ncbi:MAG: hypothetical protein KME27_31080 [Lyngbya sp. HA4199-MV5]|jgi:hypothetical protein|nr:hypothetical protein [Lyngbya sp. HA4199-MV5]